MQKNTRIEFPHGKRFAFTIIDDTDNAKVENIKPVYDLIENIGMRTTKTVWVYPPRDNYIYDTGFLMEDDTLNYVRTLQKKGFEIALHGISSGQFDRNEIIQGFEIYRELLGAYPQININHSFNTCNLYWGYKRFAFPLSLVLYCFYRHRRYYGENPDSKHFWGDIAKEHIKYMRNLTFSNINTLAVDPKMPYSEKAKGSYSNYWFSSSDGHTVNEFTKLISFSNIAKLMKSGGVCIVYTHFAKGFVNRDGKVDPAFEANLRRLAENNGWFVPAGRLLDFLLERKNQMTEDPGFFYRFALNRKWVYDRLLKRLVFYR